MLAPWGRATIWPFASSMEAGVFLFEFVDVRDLFESIFESSAAIQDIVFCLILHSAALTLPVFAVVLIVTLSARRWIAPWARHVLWTLVLLRLILPFSVTSPVSAQMIWRTIGVQKGAKFVAVNPLQSVDRFCQISQSANVSVKVSGAGSSALNSILSSPIFVMALKTILLLGLGLVMCISAVNFVRQMYWIRYGVACSDSAWIGLVDDGSRQFGIRPPVRLLKVHQLMVPAASLAQSLHSASRKHRVDISSRATASRLARTLPNSSR